MSDQRAFPWAERFDTEQLDAFLSDLWAAASGNTALTTLHVVEAAIARHRPADDGAPKCPLSDREIEVMTLMASGGTYGAVGRHLGITAASVRSHCGRVYDRLGVANAAQAAAVCAHRGWLPDLQIPELATPFKRRSGQQWNRLFSELAAEMCARPGEPVRIGPYRSSTGARGAVQKIKKGLLEPFRPAGAFTARAERIAQSRWEIEARFIGEPSDPTPSSALERPLSS